MSAGTGRNLQIPVLCCKRKASSASISLPHILSVQPELQDIWKDGQASLEAFSTPDTSLIRSNSIVSSQALARSRPSSSQCGSTAVPTERHPPWTGPALSALTMSPSRTNAVPDRTLPSQGSGGRRRSLPHPSDIHFRRL
jgi:hypothetical protein